MNEKPRYRITFPRVQEITAINNKADFTPENGYYMHQLDRIHSITHEVNRLKAVIEKMEVENIGLSHGLDQAFRWLKQASKEMDDCQGVWSLIKFNHHLKEYLSGKEWGADPPTNEEPTP